MTAMPSDPRRATFTADLALLRAQWPMLLRHGAIVLGFNSLLAVASQVANGGAWARWDIHLVYAQAIGLSIWLCIDVGRYLVGGTAQATGWPSGWRGWALPVVGTLLGFAIGTLIGQAYAGERAPHWTASQQQLAASLLMTAGVSAAITFFFYARGRDQARLRHIAEAERQAAEARLKLLETQIEPHMLFNTLANLRVLIAMDPARAQDMLDRLIDYLRATLGGSRTSSHALSAEFARLADYLALMQVRMGDRLQVQFDLPEALAARLVPPMLLQPLVENAIQHGLEPHKGGGLLQVSARLDGADLLLSVADNGRGLDDAPAHTDHANRNAGSMGTGFGLAQVRERLHTLYGDAAQLTLAPRDGGGTLVQVRLPRAMRAAPLGSNTPGRPCTASPRAAEPDAECGATPNPHVGRAGPAAG
jgi:signal transduction histidine kinase